MYDGKKHVVFVFRCNKCNGRQEFESMPGKVTCGSCGGPLVYVKQESK